MTAYRIDFSRLPSVDANSEVRAGAKLYIYSNTTTTPLSLYSDYQGLVSAVNPIVADSAGNFPVRYVGSSSRFTWALYDADDVSIWSDDNVEPLPNIANADLVNYLPLAGGTMTGAIRYKAGSDITVGSTINGDASGGNINLITGAGSTITGITLAEGAERIFVFDGVNTLTNSSTLALGGADLATHDGMVLRFKGEAAGVVRLIGGMTGTGKALRESAEIMISVISESTAITTGTAKRTFRMPFAMTLDAIPRASVSTAQTSGNVVKVDINEGGTSILSTKLTIDNNESTSTTAATAAVLSDTSLADDAQITIDVDDVDGSTTAKGLKVLLRGWRINS